MSIRPSSSALVALGLLLAACEDPPKPDTTVKSAVPSSLPAPAPTPAPVAPVVAAPRPKKKLEDCPKGPNVEFDQKEIEAEVRKKLAKPEGPITQADLKKVKSLNIATVKMPVLDVCLLSQLTGVHELFLGPGDYDDLSPVYMLKDLEALGASRSQVKDISGLAKLTKLDRLDLAHTQIEDISPLSALVSLTELTLDDTPISDVTPLAKLTKLEKLGIKHTKVKDASPLKPLKKLKVLYVGGTPADEDGVTLAPVRGNGTKVISD
ncbi:MAG TPA: leucine-rich repeat domain-containing protein [Polyangiaceae bacterium]|jgi:hypothetical protein